MRYYRIVIQEPTTGATIQEWTSTYPNGLANHGALRVEFNFPVFALNDSAGNAELKIWGVPLEMLSQQFNFNEKLILVYGGMIKGLPLANPDQSGLILKGIVQFTYSVLEHTNQYLHLVIRHSEIDVFNKPKDLTLNWKQGQKLSDAIKETLNKFTVTGKISDGLVAIADDSHHFDSFEELSSFVNQRSKAIIKTPDYAGVSISFDLGKVLIYDGTQPSDKTITLDFKDFIGQPQWKSLVEVDIVVVLRGDVFLNDTVIMPERLISQFSGVAGMYDFRSKLSFKGQFRVVRMYHLGDSRNNSPDAWVTVLNLQKIT